MNLKNKLTLIFSLLMVTIILVFSIIGYLFSEKQVSEGIKQEMNTMISSYVNTINGWLIGKVEMMEVVAGTIQTSVGDGQITTPMVAGYNLFDKELLTMYFGSADGKMVDGSGWIPEPDFDPRSRLWYKEAYEQEKLIFTDPYLDEGTNKMAVSVAMPLKNSAKQIRGVLAEEVRKLAEQSSGAAKQITGLISEVQAKTDSAVSFMKESKKTAEQTQTISAATEEQSASMEEIAASSQHLSKMAIDLQDAIKKFTV